MHKTDICTVYVISTGLKLEITTVGICTVYVISTGLKLEITTV